jgi:hypothetical protein
MSEKCQSTAFVLSLLLGTLGVDRFYLGYTGLVLIVIVGVSVFESMTGRFLPQRLWTRMKGKSLAIALVLAALSWAWNIYKHFSRSAF